MKVADLSWRSGTGLKDYAHYSFWLETCGDELTPRPRLDGDVDADVAILGAGYTGLWTAYYLLRRSPRLRVVVVEREIAGFGASGRNGGWCSAGFPVSLPVLRERYGADTARAVALAMYDAVDEVGRISTEEGIDTQYHKGGALRLARGPHQLPWIERSAATARELGLEDHYRLLDAAETAARIRVTEARGAIFTPDCATIHPGRLVRGLGRRVERRGGTIYEQTPVTHFVTGSSPRLVTPYGDVRARTIVLAGEAYLTQLQRLRRQLVPVYSLIVLTEPLSREQWAEIGWQNRECVASWRYSVDYLQHTADGRILSGGRGAPYRLGSRIDDSLDRHEPTHAMLRRMAIAWFPLLQDVRFSHAWGGPLGAPRDWMPTTSYDPAAGLATARGYTGQGVATANLAGRILTDLITGADSPLTKLPTVNHRSRSWEPEPFRWAGIRYVQRAYLRLDEQAERTGVPPTGRSLAERLGHH
jgi:glycine/D-amino acid oxidase-like deaminating enzyme